MQEVLARNNILYVVKQYILRYQDVAQSPKGN